MVIVVDVVTGVDDPPIAFVAIVAASCLTEVEQVIWNVHKDTAHCERQSIQVADSTLSILFVDEVCQAQVLRKDPPEQLAIPLDANLHEEVDGNDMFAALLRNADRAKENQVTQKAVPPPDVEIQVAVERKAWDPDVVIEIEDSPAARQRGHMVIAIENPNLDLQVKIDHRTKGQPVIGSTVRFQAI